MNKRIIMLYFNKKIILSILSLSFLFLFSTNAFASTHCTQKAVKDLSQKTYHKSTYPQKAIRVSFSNKIRSCKTRKNYSTILRIYKTIRQYSWNRWHKWDVAYRNLPISMKNYLASVRGCETRGMSRPYAANTGNGYYGAYQWSISSWYNVAGASGRPDLATPKEQDVRTARVLSAGGRHHWPNCA